MILFALFLLIFGSNQMSFWASHAHSSRWHLVVGTFLVIGGVAFLSEARRPKTGER